VPERRRLGFPRDHPALMPFGQAAQSFSNGFPSEHRFRWLHLVNIARTRGVDGGTKDRDPPKADGQVRLLISRNRTVTNSFLKRSAPQAPNARAQRPGRATGPRTALGRASFVDHAVGT
jgi:hypothetical protein